MRSRFRYPTFNLTKCMQKKILVVYNCIYLYILRILFAEIPRNLQVRSPIFRARDFPFGASRRQDVVRFVCSRLYLN